MTCRSGTLPLQTPQHGPGWLPHTPTVLWLHHFSGIGASLNVTLQTCRMNLTEHYMKSSVAKLKSHQHHQAGGAKGRAWAKKTQSGLTQSPPCLCHMLRIQTQLMGQSSVSRGRHCWSLYSVWALSTLWLCPGSFLCIHLSPDVLFQSFS